MMKKISLLLFLLAFAVATQAQTDCTKMLESAQKYYEEGKYEKAVRMIKEVIQPNCKGYGEDLLKKCNRKLQAAKQPRTQNLQDSSDAEEVAAYKRCTTEAACNDYLLSYPSGKYHAAVTAKKKRLTETRLTLETEAAKTAYMRIRKIEFANYDKDNKVIDQYGSTLYEPDIRYLKPRIIYDGMLDETRSVVLYWKIVSPDGTIKSSKSSPSGYTGSKTCHVKPGENNTCQLHAWGTSVGGSYVVGDYRLELWYDGNLIYQASFTVNGKESVLSQGNWRSALEKCNDYATIDYKGQYDKDGRYSGLGMNASENGDYYFGQWRLGNKDGDGIEMAGQDEVSNCPRCKYYVGHYFNGKKSGFGICYDNLGRVIYFGNFADDSPVQSYPMSGNVKYKFECLEYSGGNCYIGETVNGKPHGKGFYIWSNGNVWYGEWTDGERNGYGIYFPCEGFIFTGTWKGNEEQ